MAYFQLYWKFRTTFQVECTILYLYGDLDLMNYILVREHKEKHVLGKKKRKITADGDCSHEIKRHLLLGRKAMTNLDSILKSRNITLPTKSIQSKLWFFLVVMYGCESWTIKKAEHQRIDAFQLWCWRRL